MHENIFSLLPLELMDKSVCYETITRVGVDTIGLERREAEFLGSLCLAEVRYPTYEETRLRVARIARTIGSHTTATLRGCSKDYPSTRKIDLATIGSPVPGGRHGYIEATQHPSEQLAAGSAVVLIELLDKYPEIVRRLGYDAVAVCPNNDPDGTEMQRPETFTPNSMRNYILGGHRGAAEDQVSWRYPTPGFSNIGPEPEASLKTLEELEPILFAALHASVISSYSVVSFLSSQAMGRDLTDILRQFRLSISNEPESPNTRVLAPAVFEMARKDVLKELTTSDTNFGTSAVEHLPVSTLMYVPEVQWAAIDILPGDPITSFTRLDAIRHRTLAARAIANQIGLHLTSLEGWISANIETPEVGRLYRAAAWWSKVIPDAMQEELEHAAKMGNSEKLRQSECLQLIYPPIINSLLYLGDVYRLAVMARSRNTVRASKRRIDQELLHIKRLHYLPVYQQLGAQTLGVLTAMRHRAEMAD